MKILTSPHSLLLLCGMLPGAALTALGQSPQLLLQKLPLKTALLLTPEFCARNIKTQIYGFTADADVGKDACPQLEAAVRSVFSTVTRVSVAATPGDYQLLLQPDPISAGPASNPAAFTGRFEMSAVLSWTATDASGRIVWLEKAEGIAKGRQGFGPVFSTLPKALKKTLEEAVKNAVSQSAAKMSSAAEFRDFMQSPSLDELQKQREGQLLKLSAYKPGTTTREDFQADGWNARDPFIMKFGIVSARFDNLSQSAEYEVSCCLANNKPLGDRAHANLENSRSMNNTPVVTYSSKAIDSRGIPGPESPRYLVRFIGGKLVSVTKQ